MLRRNGLVVKSAESVLRQEGSLWWERFMKEVYNANMLHVHHILLKWHAVTIISFQIWVTKQWKQRSKRFHLIVIDWYRLWICCKANVFVDLSRLYSGQAQTFWMRLVCVICSVKTLLDHYWYLHQIKTPPPPPWFYISSFADEWQGCYGMDALPVIQPAV